jgi:radical SAM superfamily enzyme YgiQ (UPF0313 family)
VGLLYLAAVIRESFGERYTVGIYDCGLPAHGRQHLLERIQAERPGIIGFSTMCCEAEWMHELAGAVREAAPEAVILVGGPHPTVVGPEVLADASLDIAVIGEAERTIVELLAALDRGDEALSGVPGIAWRRNGELRRNEPRPFIQCLDDLPRPAWDLVSFDDYSSLDTWNGTLKWQPYAPVVTSRGCPYRCTYCHSIFGKTVRARSPENVVGELEHLAREHGVREVHIIDDVFNFDGPRLLRIAELIEQRGLRLAFAFPNGLRADLLDPELVAALRRMGTYKIHIGIETVTPRFQEMIRKDLEIEKVQRAIELADHEGIATGGYFMLGFPGETREEMMATIRFAAESRLDAAYFFKATSFPGSEFEAQLRQEGRAEETRSEDQHFFSVSRSYAAVPPEELNELLLLAQKTFYLRPSRIWRGFWKAPRKWRYLRGIMRALTLILYGYLLHNLKSAAAQRAEHAPAAGAGDGNEPPRR